MRDNRNLPTKFTINSLYPNPFNSELKLHYSLKHPSPADLALVNLDGRVMWQKDMELQGIGMHTASISASDFPSGVYFVRIGNGREILNRKVVLLK